MKIAIFHELDFGGAKRTVEEFAKRLNKNHIVDIYYVDDDRDDNAEDFFNKTYWYKFVPKVWKGNNWKTRLYKDTAELISLYNLHKRIAHDIKSKNYDCIFVHPSRFTQAPFLLSFLKNKCIYYCQEPLRIVYDPIISDTSHIKFPKNIYEFLNRRIRKWIDKKNFDNAKIVLTNSNYSKEFIEKSYEKKPQICYLGVDTDLFTTLNLNKSIDVLFIGNEDIGYDLLNKLSEYFDSKLKVRVIFRESGRPNVTDKELAEIYNKSKVMVALNHNEPFGLIPLEAMACGIPVIAINEGGYKESVVNGETGYLIEEDPQELKDAISKLLNNDKLRIDMGEDARKHIEKKWTWDKSIERFMSIIKNAE